MATTPGMPQTTLVAWSWAITVPPAAVTALQPCKPSWPMPVRMITSASAPKVSAMLRNIGSTAGRQKLSGGVVVKRIRFSVSFASTIM